MGHAIVITDSEGNNTIEVYREDAESISLLNVENEDGTMLSVVLDQDGIVFQLEDESDTICTSEVIPTPHQGWEALVVGL